MINLLGTGTLTSPSPTIAEFTRLWLEDVGGLRPRSLDSYETTLRRHAIPRIGHLTFEEITTSDIASLVSDLQREGLAPNTILTVLTPLKRVFDNAVRRGLLAANPVNGLERHERPRSRHDEMRILNSDEIDALLSAAPAKYRTLLATAVFTGLRSGELLGLHWSDIDFAVGVVHVSRQVDKTGRRLVPEDDRTPIATWCSSREWRACSESTACAHVTRRQTSTSSRAPTGERCMPTAFADVASMRR